MICCFSDKNAIVYNSHCGHMLRTKLEKSNEGGVAAGSGALDSPYLYDDWYNFFPLHIFLLLQQLISETTHKYFVY